MHSSENRYIHLLRWLGYLTIFATVVSLYDRLWFFELFSHFTIQYLIILALLATVFLFRRNSLSLIFIFFTMVNLYKIHDLTAAQVTKDTQVSPGIKIATLNLDMNNTQFIKVQDFIRDTSADLLLLVEITPEWASQLSILEKMYPYSHALIKEDGFGIALFSRFQLSHSKTIALDDPVNPALVTQIDINGTKVTVAGVHLFAPMTNHYFHARNRQLDRLALLINENGLPTITLGDLNITSWSSYFRRFVERTSLRESTIGEGLQPTWPSYFFPFYIQLDHILLSEEFSVISSKSAAYVGSDHYPLVAEISLSGKQATR